MRKSADIETLQKIGKKERRPTVASAFKGYRIYMYVLDCNNNYKVTRQVFYFGNRSRFLKRCKHFATWIRVTNLLRIIGVVGREWVRQHVDERDLADKKSKGSSLTVQRNGARVEGKSRPKFGGIHPLMR